MKILNVTGRSLVWFLAIGVALASWRFFAGGVEATMEIVAQNLEARSIPLYAHIVFAPIALALMPFQFWAGLRRKHPIIHRNIGKISIVAILISGVGGMIIAPFSSAGLAAATGFFVLSILWMGSTLIAYRHVRAGRIKEHREWMMRAAAMTFAAVTLRLWIPFYFLATDLEFAVFYPIIAWQCWVLNLIVVEVYLRWRRDRLVGVVS